MDDGASDTPKRIVGLSKDDAVDALLAEDESRDPEYVRAVLDHVTDDDGAVTQSAVDSAVTDTSMMLSTAETRVELAEIALSEAEEEASDVADVDAVRTRLDSFEETVTAAEERVSALGSELQSLSHWQRDDRPVFDLVTELRDVASDAQTVQMAADDTQLELEDFERWLADHDLRRRDLDTDVDALEQSLDDISRTREKLSNEEYNDDDAAHAWYEAALRCRVVPLLVADVRAELDDLRELASRDDVDETGGLDDIGERLDDIDTRAERLTEQLDSLAQSAWTDRYGDALDAFQSALDEFEPPVSWGAVQEALDQYRQDPSA
ncbi:halo transducer protein [Haloferax larsenii]|uniref:Halo transducer protein n=1 Tax=Haloferax larsenii TaxID=302484 RepID=A0ABY5RFC8_HALLR|nr:halo transducer protein [Haloferax larsenii]UVE51072.1 halo transducer protein [Haloferax larsenii]